MFIINKYYFYYFNIITRAKSRATGSLSYCEKHHIIPRSLGGNNDPDNIVALSAKEHLVCHRLLTKFTTGTNKSKMIYAVWRMAYSCKKHKRVKLTSRVYEEVRKQVSALTRERNRSRKHSEETRKKISDSKIGKTRNITPEWRQKIVNSQTGMTKKPCSAETKEKISQAKTGKKLGPLNDEHRKRVSESKKGKKIQVDPITGRRFYQTLE